jgi:hypothetical protein
MIAAVGYQSSIERMRRAHAFFAVHLGLPWLTQCSLWFIGKNKIAKSVCCRRRVLDRFPALAGESLRCERIRLQ